MAAFGRDRLGRARYGAVWYGFSNKTLVRLGVAGLGEDWYGEVRFYWKDRGVGW